MNIDFAAIGDRIKKARLSKGINQIDLASQLDISVSHMSDIETGKTNFGVDILLNISEALQVSTDSLLRPDTPSANALYTSEFEEIMKGCTSAEKEVILRTALSMKDAFLSINHK